MKKVLGFLAVAGLLFIAAPSQQAQAAALATPASVVLAQHASENMATEVHYRRGHHSSRHRTWRPRSWKGHRHGYRHGHRHGHRHGWRR